MRTIASPAPGCPRVAGSRLVTLACSHISNVEKSEEFNEAVRQFLTAGP